MEVALFGISWAAVWIAAGAVPRGQRGDRFTWLFPALGILLLVLFRDLPPVYRLLASSLLFLYLMKAAVLLSLPDVRLSRVDRLLFSTIWPGMDPERLAKRQEANADTGRRFAHGLVATLAGVGSGGAVALFAPQLGAAAVGWLGIATVLLTLHFGFSNVLTALMWLAGRPVDPLFDRPLASESLSNFWSRRWNRAFVDMDRRLFLPLVRRHLPLRWAVVAVFLFSGLLHEMAISYPADGGWGGPMLYFLIQGLATIAERRLKVRSRLLTWICVLGPLPLLFHAPFRETLIVPFFFWLHDLLVSHPLSWYVEMLLWSLGAMQLSVLMASAQVPRRLNWYEELPRLSPFNQKLMWTYALFIVATVVSFAVLTLALHSSFMRGEPAAIGLAAFMSFFWCLRLAFDTFYYRSEDWPEGAVFKVGHALLNALFVYLALGYGAVALWGWLQH